MLKDWRQTPSTRRVLVHGPQAGSHLEFVVELCAWLCRARPAALPGQPVHPDPAPPDAGCGMHLAPLRPRSGGGPAPLAWRRGPARLGGQPLAPDHARHRRDPGRSRRARPGARGTDPRPAARRGASEYLVMAVPLADGRRNAVSWATDAPGGFTLAARNELRNLAGPLGLILDLLEWRRTARTLLDTYLGRGPGREVLNGAIRRGDRRDLEAASCSPICATLPPRPRTGASISCSPPSTATTRPWSTRSRSPAARCSSSWATACSRCSRSARRRRWRAPCQRALAAVMAAPRNALEVANRAQRRGRRRSPRLRRRAARRPGGLWQHRRPGAPRLHRDRARGQPGQPRRGSVQAAPPAACSRPRPSPATSAASWPRWGTIAFAASRSRSACSACPKPVALASQSA